MVFIIVIIILVCGAFAIIEINKTETLFYKEAKKLFLELLDLCYNASTKEEIHDCWEQLHSNKFVKGDKLNIPDRLIKNWWEMRAYLLGKNDLLKIKKKDRK